MAIYIEADNMEKFNGQNDSWTIAVDRFSVSETQGREHKSTAVLEESKTNRGSGYSQPMTFTFSFKL